MKNILLNLEESLLIPDGGVSASGMEAGFGIWGFVRMLLILAILIGALYCILRVVRKAGGSSAQDSGRIRIVASKALSQGKALYIVEADGRSLLVGVSERCINLVAKLDDAEEKNE